MKEKSCDEFNGPAKSGEGGSRHGRSEVFYLYQYGIAYGKTTFEDKC